jgi:hypothetical protein
MSVKTISKKEDLTVSKEDLIQKLNSQFQAVEELPKPTVSKVMIGPNVRAQSQYSLY